MFNEFVQMEKKTFMSEYEEGDAEEADYNLGGHGGMPLLSSPSQGYSSYSCNLCHGKNSPCQPVDSISLFRSSCTHS